MIISTEHVIRFIRRYDWNEGSYQSGLLLSMEDGSKWFHPYSGADPRKES